ncbi:MAG: NTP transferase domain-containing protein [Lachnospiraceae bacterium]|nr:NTP transferase domain-containing protein [Lachnospiraceae bacterium]
MKQVIVMAAGLGSRLKELTTETPKPLLKVNGKSMLETNIEYMIEAGIDRVIIIVGYLKEKFYYLKDKYKEQIVIEYVVNEQYADFNTIRSMYCARTFFECDSYFITADNFLMLNLYKKYQADYSFYLLRPYQHFEKEEWTVELDNNLRFVNVDLHGHDGYAYSGVSFWKLKDMQYIRERLEEVDWEDEKTKKMYWDNVLLPHLKEFAVHAIILENNSEFYEVDDQEDLLKLSNYLKGVI